MRRLETRRLRLYYPEPLQAHAHRLATRLEHCLDQLLALPQTPSPADKALVFLTRRFSYT